MFQSPTRRLVALHVGVTEPAEPEHFSDLSLPRRGTDYDDHMLHGAGISTYISAIFGGEYR